MSKNLKISLYCLVGAGLMLTLAFWSSELYVAFCQATGFAGTPGRVASEDAEKKLANVNIDTKNKVEVVIRFDGNVGKGIDWEFGPLQESIKINVGEKSKAYFTAHNLSDETVTGMATFNVTPPQAAKYFKKIECFCFSEISLKPDEKRKMPIIFYIDKGMLKDFDTKNTRTLTLSYTMYKLND